MSDNLNFSSNALVVLKKRYLTKNEKGTIIETPRQMVERVTEAIANVERKYGSDKESVDKFKTELFNSIAELEFLPNSPTLMNAGKELGQLSACFVVPVEDSMESIFDAIKTTALIHKTGGGTGFSFSRLRSKASIVKSTGGVASGPVSFMKVFDAATQAVKQGGTRRGANMGILRVDHPDILEFIQCKEKEGDIANFNISIAITNLFMEKVIKNEEYSLIDPHNGVEVSKANAREVFDKIAQFAHKNGEPGIIFIDRINEHNPTPHLGEIESTNPCGEQPLLPFESCNLGSLNLARMLKSKTDGFSIDWDKLERTTKLAVRFLDNVIDANRFPLPIIKDNTLRTRKIGLGVMGWATLLGFLDIAYDTDEAVNLAKKLMDFVYRHAKEESVRLAKERGVFPSWRKSVWDKRGTQIRNATLTTIAPTGTISIIAGPTSSGIEPNFALGYFRNVMEGEKLLELDPAFEWVAKKHGFYSPELMKRIASGESIQKMQEVPEHIKNVFKTAMDITPYWHIKMQAAFQEFTDNAVSKTINLAHAATLEDIKESYLLSYKLNCKGVTVYRDGSRDVQVLTTDASDKKKEPAKKDLSALGVVTIAAAAKPKARPDVISGTTAKLTTGCGNLYITVNQDDDGGLFEVFMQMGKAGGCAASQLEAVGRLVSTALRGGIDIKVIIEQLKGIRCPSPSWANGQKIFSCADAIARALEQRIVEQKNTAAGPQTTTGQPVKPAVKILTAKPEAAPMRVSQELATVVGVCSECGNALRHQEGCLVCDGCGFSKC